MTPYTFDTARSTLVVGPRLWGCPASPDSIPESWRILALIAARALHEVAAATVSSHAHDAEPSFAFADVLCEVIAEDLRPEPNLIAADVRATLLFLATAFALQPGPEDPPMAAAPSIPDCHQAINLALDGLIPSAYLDQFYATLGGRCPRCATHALGHRPARSRVDPTRMVCSECGLHEAMLGLNAPRADTWPVEVPAMLHELQAKREDGHVPFT